MLSSKCRQTLSEYPQVDICDKICDAPATLNSLLQVDGFKMFDTNYRYQHLHY